MYACLNVSNRFVYHSNFLTLIVTTTRIFIDRFGAAAVPSVMESIPSLRHRYIVPSSSSEVVFDTTTPVFQQQRGDQQPVDEDDELFSSEILLPGDEVDESREVPYRGGDYFQRPGMINNHINYNKYNSIFKSANSMRHQRQNGERLQTVEHWQNSRRATSVSSYQRGGRLIDLIVH